MKTTPMPLPLEKPRPSMDTAPSKTFMDRLADMARLYEGCGNMLGIVPLTTAGYQEADFRKDAKLRASLAQWGRAINSDSVMVLVGDPTKRAEQGYHTFMYVFEPSGSDDSGMEGGVSTMCGNGIRAVAAYIREQDPTAERAEIMTMSGLRTVEFIGDNYSVQMGNFVQSTEALGQYVDSQKVASIENEYFNSPIPAEIVAKLAPFVDASTWSIGLNGDPDEDGQFNGEPHAVIEVPLSQAPDIQTLRQLAVTAGPLITKETSLFPQEININFIVVQGLNPEDGKVHIMNCTHERNLGDDADHSVTAACGTGSTVASGTILRRYFPGKDDQVIVVHNIGGDLEISKNPDNPNRMVMTGPAEICDLEVRLTEAV